MPASFVVLGDFDPENPSTIDRDTLLEWISEDTVDYKGFVNDVRPFLEKSTCIVLPSHREGMPRIVLEAMAMGKPGDYYQNGGMQRNGRRGCQRLFGRSQGCQRPDQSDGKILCPFSGAARSHGEKGRAMAAAIFSDTIIADDLFRIFCLSMT